MKTYIYRGPTSGFTLPDQTEVMLHDGKEYPLPETHPYVKTLIARRHLEEVPAKPAKASKTQTPKSPQEKTQEAQQ